MLDELISYSYENKRKFDIVAAFGMALLADEELIGKVARAQQGQNKKLKLGYYRSDSGQVQFGASNNTEKDFYLYGRPREKNKVYY